MTPMTKVLVSFNIELTPFADGFYVSVVRVYSKYYLLYILEHHQFLGLRTCPRGTIN